MDHSPRVGMANAPKLKNTYSWICNAVNSSLKASTLQHALFLLMGFFHGELLNSRLVACTSVVFLMGGLLKGGNCKLIFRLNSMYTHCASLCVCIDKQSLSVCVCGPC